MSDCRALRVLLSSAVDEVLSPSERAELDTHLERCAGCRTDLEELRRTTRRIREVQPVEPPPWMATRIMARVLEEARPTPSLWRRYLLPVLASPQFRAATLILVVAAGVYIVRQSGIRPLPVETLGRPASAPAPEASRTRDEKASASEARPPERAALAPSTARPAPRKQLAAPSGDGGTFAPPPSSVARDDARSAPEPEIVGRAMDQPAAPPAPAGPLAPSAAGATRARGEMKLEQAAPPARAAASAKDAATASLAAAPPAVALSIEPFDRATAGEAVEAALRALGAEIAAPVGGDRPSAVTARLPSHRIPELLDRLARVGTVRERPAGPEGLPAVTTVTVRW